MGSHLPMHQAEEKPRKITPNRACLCQDMWTLNEFQQPVFELKGKVVQGIVIFLGYLFGLPISHEP